MSDYANYTVDSEDYDKTRAAIGVETVLGCLARTGVPLGDQTVLEAGCGVGKEHLSECDAVHSRGISSAATGRRVRHQRNITRTISRRILVGRFDSSRGRTPKLPNA